MRGCFGSRLTTRAAGGLSLNGTGTSCRVAGPPDWAPAPDVISRQSNKTSADNNRDGRMTPIRTLFSRRFRHSPEPVTSRNVWVPDLSAAVRDDVSVRIHAG